MAQQTKDVIDRAKKQLADLTGFSSPAVVGIARQNHHWLLTIELLEKESIPDGMDVLGVYQVVTDADGNVRSYQREEIRRRSDTKQSEEGEE